MMLTQVLILLITVLKPETSRIIPAIILTLLNYLQMINLAMLAFIAFATNFFKITCLNSKVIDNIHEESMKREETL
jgi:hypothetical protein